MSTTEKIKKKSSSIKEEDSHNISVPFSLGDKKDGGVFDLNKMFQVNFSFNFDLMKTLIEGIVKSQKTTQEDIYSIKYDNLQKNIKIQELEKKIFDLDLLVNKSLETERSGKPKTEEGGQQKTIESKGSTINAEAKEGSPNREKYEKKNRYKKIRAPLIGINIEPSLNNDDLINKIIVRKNNILIFIFL